MYFVLSHVWNMSSISHSVSFQVVRWGITRFVSMHQKEPGTSLLLFIVLVIGFVPTGPLSTALLWQHFMNMHNDFQFDAGTSNRFI